MLLPHQHHVPVGELYNMESLQWPQAAMSVLLVIHDMHTNMMQTSIAAWPVLEAK